MKERKALGVVRDTILKYMKAIAVANEAIMEGETVTGIDRQVKINDGPAINAIASLRKAVHPSLAGENGKSKSDLYGRMLSALGYGGMIHNFSNYIIRRDRPRVEKIRKFIRDFRTAAQHYAALNINDTERKALAEIEKAVSEYERNINVVTELIAKGLLPADISHRLKHEEKSLLRGLAALDRSILREIAASKARLSQKLKRAAGFGKTVLWIALVATLLVAGLNSLIVFSRIVGPIRKIRNTMFKLAQGNMDVKIDYIERADEVGSMARAIEVFRQNALEVNRLEKDKLKLEEMAARERRKSMSDLASNFENSVGAVVEATKKAVSSLEQTAVTLQQNADSSVMQADDVNRAADRSAENVSAVASSSQQLESSISMISGEVEQSRAVAEAALDSSQKSRQTMQDLMERAGKINNIVEMINDIAGQTNLLALNATIEASRAGEAGRGFAVVASEVKTLAEQTSKATEEIASQIAALQTISTQAADNMTEIDEVITRMGEFSRSVAEAIAEQNAATTEITHNIEQAAAGSNEVRQGISMVRSAAHETGNTVNMLKACAQELSVQSAQLDSKVTGFVGTIRTSWH